MLVTIYSLIYVTRLYSRFNQFNELSMLKELVFPTCVDSIYFLYLSYKITIFTGRSYQMCQQKIYPFNEL